MLPVCSSFTAKVAEVAQREQSKSNVEHQMMNIESRSAHSQSLKPAQKMLLVRSSFTAKVAEVVQRAQREIYLEHRI